MTRGHSTDRCSMFMAPGHLDFFTAPVGAEHVLGRTGRGRPCKFQRSGLRGTGCNKAGPAHRYDRILTMNHEKFRNDLQKLRTELQAINSLDEGEQTLLRQVESEIEALLSRDNDNLRADRESRQRLGAALAEVEAAHPRLTLLMRQMVDSLSYLGI